MSIIFKVVMRPTEQRVPNSPKKCYRYLITLGQCVHPVYLDQKLKDPSLQSICDFKIVIQNFMDKMKELLQDMKPMNIEGIGVSRLSMRPKGADLIKNITVKRVRSLDIFLLANKELCMYATHEEQASDLFFMDDYDKDGT